MEAGECVTVWRQILLFYEPKCFIMSLETILSTQQRPLERVHCNWSGWWFIATEWKWIVEVEEEEEVDGRTRRTLTCISVVNSSVGTMFYHLISISRGICLDKSSALVWYPQFSQSLERRENWLDSEEPFFNIYLTLLLQDALSLSLYVVLHLHHEFTLIVGCHRSSSMDPRLWTEWNKKEEFMESG